MRKGILLVLSGPSGVGKSTVLRELFRIWDGVPLFFSVSMTTRAARPGEVDGVNYIFTERSGFTGMIEQGGFLEYAEYAGNYYGTPKAPVDDCIQNGGCALLDIEIQGMRQVVSQMPDAVTVFLSPPSSDDLRHRLRLRNTETEESILRRLEIAERETAAVNEYTYMVINDIPERAAADIAAIMRAELLKVSRKLS